MGTLSRTLIKGVDKTELIELIREQFALGRTVTLDHEYREVFLDQENWAIIVFEAFSDYWIEVCFDAKPSFEQLDVFLQGISDNYKTIVIDGYEQTTTGDARLKIWNNGEVVRSVYQKSCYEPHRIVMEENAGDRLAYEHNFSYPEMGQSVENYKMLSFDDIQNMFINGGYKAEERIRYSAEYIHLEYLNSNSEKS